MKKLFTKKLHSIELGFENGDCITVQGDDVMALELAQITQSISKPYHSTSVVNSHTAHDIFFILARTANVEYHNPAYPCPADTHTFVFKRIQDFHDITSIDVKYTCMGIIPIIKYISVGVYQNHSLAENNPIGNILQKEYIDDQRNLVVKIAPDFPSSSMEGRKNG